MDTFPELHNREAEEAVIGGLLIAPDLFQDLTLKPDDFYLHRLRFIWEAFQRLDRAGVPADSITIEQELADMGRLDEVGGEGYLTGLLNASPNCFDTPHYADIVADYATRRRVVQAANRAATLAYDLSIEPERALAESEQGFAEIQTGERDHTANMAQGLRAAYDVTEQASRGHVLTVKTGFVDIDKIVKLQAPDLAILAGRPGMGKTACLLTIADNLCKEGAKVAFFSLEMSIPQVNMRLIAMHSGVSVGKQREGKLSSEEWERYNQAVETLQNHRLFVNDRASLTLREMRQAMRSIGRCDLVIVDYLQLMAAEGKHQNRETEVSSISRGLKAVAKDFNAPVLAAAQLSREVEKRAERRPQLSDLRESGSLEQDASVVWFISRDAQASTEASLETAKNRDGEVGYAKLVFNGLKGRFESVALMRM